MLQRVRRVLSFALLGGLLHGCAVKPPVALTDSNEARQWSGRFSASYPDARSDTGQGRATGRFRLERGQGDLVLLELSSPLGQQIARARVSRDMAELQDARGETHRAASDELLTEALFGWRIPVRALPQWLKATNPGQGNQKPSSQVGPTPSAEALDQGWRIRSSLSAQGNTRIFDLVFPAAETDPSRRISLRLVIDSVR